MSVTVVRYQTKPDRADENQALIEKVFGELATSGPDGLRYAAFRLADGVSFVHVASVETADGTNPLTTTPALVLLVGSIPSHGWVQAAFGVGDARSHDTSFGLQAKTMRP